MIRKIDEINGLEHRYCDNMIFIFKKHVDRETGLCWSDDQPGSIQYNIPNETIRLYDLVDEANRCYETVAVINDSDDTHDQVLGRGANCYGATDALARDPVTGKRQPEYDLG